MIPNKKRTINCLNNDDLDKLSSIYLESCNVTRWFYSEFLGKKSFPLQGNHQSKPVKVMYHCRKRTCTIRYRFSFIISFHMVETYGKLFAGLWNCSAVWILRFQEFFNNHVGIGLLYIVDLWIWCLAYHVIENISFLFSGKNGYSVGGYRST